MAETIQKYNRKTIPPAFQAHINLYRKCREPLFKDTLRPVTATLPHIINSMQNTRLQGIQ